MQKMLTRVEGGQPVGQVPGGRAGLGDRAGATAASCVRVLRAVMPGWEHPERRMRSLFKMARYQRRNGCYVPGAGLREARARAVAGTPPTRLSQAGPAARGALIDHGRRPR